MTERDAYEQLFARYGPRRARLLVRVVRLLLHGADDLRRRGYLSTPALEQSLRAVRLAGIDWPDDLRGVPR
jgi:hypothetical protein